MNKNHMLLLLVLVASDVAYPHAAPLQMPTHEMTVPNFDDEGPACVFKVPSDSSHCTAKACLLAPPAKSTLESLEVDFSCIPKSAPTGFENPPSYIKVQYLVTKNARGHLSVADDMHISPPERYRHLSFCLYGKFNNVCGYAKVMRLGDRSKGDGTRTVKAFIEGIELREPWANDRR